MARRSAGVRWYVTTERPARPANHSKRCQCDRCRAAGMTVTAPSPQLALRVLGPKLAREPAPAFQPPPPAPATPAPPRAPKPKRVIPPLPDYSQIKPAAPPPGGYRAWIDEQRKKP